MKHINHTKRNKKTALQLFTPEQEQRIRELFYEYVHSSLRVYVNGVEQPTDLEQSQPQTTVEKPPELPEQLPDAGRR